MTQPSQSFVVSSEFDGPIGLLVELIERNKIEVTSISLERITSEYLAHVAQMKDIDPGHLADFIQLGSRLTYIKSLALLPSSPEAAEELVALETDLAEYRRYQQAAATLSARLNEARTWGRGSQENFSHTPALPNIDVMALSEAFQAALRRSQPLGPTAVLKRHLDLSTVISKVRQQLTHGGTSLQSLLDTCRDRLEIVVTFLAVLELVKEGTLSVVQKDQFTDITLHPSRTES